MRLIGLIILALLCGYGMLQVNHLFPDNYIKIYLAGYVMEVNLLVLLLLLFASVLVFYIAVRLLGLVLKSGSSWSRWRGRRNKDKADAKLGEGYLSLIKGDWRKAEAQLTTKTQYSAVPYVNYLAAAQAAQEQGSMAQRDHYLELAYQAAPKERLAIGMTKAKLHQTAGQFDEALTTLSDVKKEGQKNAQFTAMLLQCHQQLGNWHEAQGLLPAARKQDALPNTMLDELQHDIDAHALQTAEDKSAAWRALSRQQKKHLANIELHVAYLLQDDQHSDAEKLIRGTLKNTWSDQLVDAYGRLKVDKPAKLLRATQGWLMARPENPQLLLAAGRLAYADKNIDTAKEYLEQAIIQGQLPAAFELLGKLYEANNETGKALELYRSGMQAAAQGAVMQDHKALADASAPIAASRSETAESVGSAEESAVSEGELIEAKAATS